MDTNNIHCHRLQPHNFIQKAFKMFQTLVVILFIFFLGGEGGRGKVKPIQTKCSYPCTRWSQLVVPVICKKGSLYMWQEWLADYRLVSCWTYYSCQVWWRGKACPLFFFLLSMFSSLNCAAHKIWVREYLCMQCKKILNTWYLRVGAMGLVLQAEAKPIWVLFACCCFKCLITCILTHV